jgi:ABC-type cobalamin/Fe3+-siderophores transport system ATPase subunit
MIALKEGRVAACGTPQEVMTPVFFANVFGVEAEVLGDKGFFIRDQINEHLECKGEQK